MKLGTPFEPKAPGGAWPLQIIRTMVRSPGYKGPCAMVPVVTEPMWVLQRLLNLRNANAKIFAVTDASLLGIWLAERLFQVRCFQPPEKMEKPLI